jgi:hypothetical protein
MGTWTVLANPPSFAASTTLLLTDGTVMVNEDSSRRWFRLTPDTSGGYRNGTWSSLADAGVARLYYDSAVLADGRVLVMGGEYSDASGTFKQDWTGTGEIYDPLTDTWTSTPAPPFASASIGDAAACLLADGRLLVGDVFSTSTAIYDPTTNTWSSTASSTSLSNEASWVLLPDDSVLSVTTYNPPQAERYVPASGSWVNSGPTPAGLVDVPLKEFGPAVTLPDGRVFAVGGTGRTALYTAPAGGSGTGSWSTGPDINDTDGTMMTAKDAPACLLPNGRVLILAGPAGAGGWSSASRFFEFDGTSIVRVADAANAGGVTYVGRLLLVPSGEVLFTDGSGTVAVYTPDAGYDATWQPVITSCPTDVQLGQTFTLRGRQLNGLSQASVYGDDVQNSTNYPIVRARNASTGAVSYWRTAHHSTMGIGTGALEVSTRFTVPPGIDQGTYDLVVIANGIPSNPLSVSVDTGSGPASYLLVDRYIGGGAVLWAYASGAWHGTDVSDADLAGIAQDLFAANRVDAYWSGTELTIARGWKNL